MINEWEVVERNRKKERVTEEKVEKKAKRRRYKQKH